MIWYPIVMWVVLLITEWMFLQYEEKNKAFGLIIFGLVIEFFKMIGLTF